ncbi:TCR/Tet family MFS transporter [Defluviimonas sp. WL0075]|uniref:TCR/Tet family MFS transporter n=1 Tax=Albidovulum sediminicola TaxID=2984331 RepID=A0ABT2YXG3_9RHOB|nr:TCR/Tet family MFS transporter [Defluviimonas sp. WL0075]MCV2863567.1 TCR/Tet family MFS transporter [Defluviimonas sp. WL0075]
MQNRLALIFILATVAIDSIGIGIIFPVMPDLMRQVTGASLADAALWGGVLATAFAAMQFLCGPVVGNLSDRFGRRPVMLVALATMALDYLVMALAQSVWLLLAARIVAGASAATYATAGAYVADISGPQDRARSFGLIGAAFGVGFVLGPLIGGAASLLDVRAPFVAAAAIAGANLLFGWLILPESLPQHRRRRITLARANPFAAFRAIGHLPGLRRYLVVMFLYTMCFTAYPAVWSYFGTAQFGWDGWWNGLSLAIFGVFMALVQGLGVAPATRRWGEERTAVYGAAMHVLTFGFYGLVTSGFWALAFTPIAALGDVAGPALQGRMTNLTPDDQQGELQGVIASVSAVAATTSPLIMTWIFAHYTRVGAAPHWPGAPFMLSAAIMAGVVLLLVAPTRAPSAPPTQI